MNSESTGLLISGRLLEVRILIAPVKKKRAKIRNEVLVKIGLFQILFFDKDCIYVENE